MLEPIRVESPPHGPEVRLLHARSAGPDDRVLRDSARALTAKAGAPYASRSYRYPYAIVAWHRTAVGIDIERVQQLDDRFAASICTPAERVDYPAPRDPNEYFCSMWSSKEALAKALGTPVSYDPRRLDAPMLWPEGHAGRWQATTLAVPGAYVAWLCWSVA